MATNISATAVEESIREFETALGTLISDTRGQQELIPDTYGQHDLDEDSTIQEIESAITEIHNLITDLRVDYAYELLKKQK